MRIGPLLVGACLLSCTPAPPQKPVPPAPSQTAAREYAGIYISTSDEDYFSPCGVAVDGDGWSLRFRDAEPRAPFLKKVTAMRGYAPLTHFIRVRGRLGSPGSYNLGFQTQELAVDTVLAVTETLSPCPGFGVPAAWSRLSARFSDLKGIALSPDRRLAALMDNQRRISIWSSETGALVRKFSSLEKRDARSDNGVPMTFSGDGSLLAIGGVDGIVRVFRPRDGKRVFSLALKDSAAVAQEIAKTPPRTDGWSPPPPPNSYTPARQIVFNKTGSMLATTNLFSSIIWSMKTGKKLAEFKLGNDFRRQVFFVENDGLIMTADSGRTTFRSYLDATPATRPDMRLAESDRVTLSPDGRTIVTSGWTDSAFVWPVAGGPPRLLRVPAFVTGVTAFSPDGNTIAFAGGMFGLYLYDTRTGAPVRSFHNFPGALTGAWFTTDGKAIITVSGFDDRFRIIYLDPASRPAGEQIVDDSLTATMPLGPPPSSTPRTIGGTVTGADKRAVAGAEVSILNGDTPNSVVARTTTSAGGYFSFGGIRFRHVLIRVVKPGFGLGVKYIHVNRWEDDGPWSIELVPQTVPTAR